MNLTEKMAYLRGLSEGMKLDESKDEVKLIKRLIEAVTDIAEELQELQDYTDELAEQVDAVDEDLAEIEDDYYGDECNCDDECDCCDDECDCEDEPYYEVTCDNCGETICVTEDVLLCGEINCPKCNKLLEFDFSDLVDCDDCDCDDCDCDCDECQTEDEE